MMVFFCLEVLSVFHRNRVNGREQILHSAPCSSLIICMKDWSDPRQFSHTEGISLLSHPERLTSNFGAMTFVIC